MGIIVQQKTFSAVFVGARREVEVVRDGFGFPPSFVWVKGLGSLAAFVCLRRASRSH